MVERFGPYELHSLIGRGGMGEVYRAVDTRKRRGVVALKRLPAGLATDPDFHRRFMREAELAARLRDPHVIPIHDYGEIGGQPYLEMRLVDGVDLATILDERGALPVERAIGVITQVASALDAAHTEGLVHRDVKPQNVLIHNPSPVGDHRSDFVYLIDFGIAANMLSSRRSSSVVSGTAAYMAPERFAAGGDHRVDVYALGCMFYETLTGEPPFRGDFMQLMAAHVHAEPPTPSRRRPGLPARLDEVTRRAMAKSPNRRFSTAGALAAAIQGSGLPAPSVDRPPHPTIRSRGPDGSVGGDEPRRPVAAAPPVARARSRNEGGDDRHSRFTSVGAEQLRIVYGGRGAVGKGRDHQSTEQRASGCGPTAIAVLGLVVITLVLLIGVYGLTHGLR